MIRGAVLGAVLLVSGMALVPAPAQADSFAFSYSSGGWYGQPRHGHYHGHRHYDRSYYSYRQYWGPPPYYYAPPPRVVVVEPQYYPPPQVLYAPSPYGQVSAVPASPVFRAPNGQYCREYQAGVTVNGYQQPSYGTACLMPDGAWRVVN